MGHIHLGRLPSSKKWRAVADLISNAGTDVAIAAAAADAAENDFLSAPTNPTFIEAVRLLGLIPQAAKQNDFIAALRENGIDVPAEPSLSDLVSATTRHLDQFSKTTSGTNDFSELATRVLVGTLSAEIGAKLPSLFDPIPAELKSQTATFTRSDEFSRLARTFFGSLVRETLSYWLDRTLSAQVGADKRFSSLEQRAAFDASLQTYCGEATRIIKEFAGGWYGKTIFRDGTITPERARVFAGVAFKKITEELKRKRADDV